MRNKSGKTERNEDALYPDVSNFAREILGHLYIKNANCRLFVRASSTIRPR